MTENTYFASPERATEQELEKAVSLAGTNPVMSGILHAVGGLLAILDEHRQIVAINDSFLQMLGVNYPEEAHGLRLGEAVGCKHAHDKPAGCGTTRYCSTCGAAIATVSCLADNQPVEEFCAIQTAGEGGTNGLDLALKVRCQPLTVGGQKFLLVFIQDVSAQQQKAALERVFFHDINNMLTTLVGASELLAESDTTTLVNTVYRASRHLLKEVAIQQCLTDNRVDGYQPLWSQVTPEEIFTEIRILFANHPLTRCRSIVYPQTWPKGQIRTDLTIMVRILSNMIINGLEASGDGAEVRLDVEKLDDGLLFKVWSGTYIVEDVARRVFQRNFSTRAESGRGLGTYSMQLFGERILGGLVEFSTDSAAGTTFTLWHPG